MNEAMSTITRITAPPGGVATREVGAITGDLDVWLDPPVARVRYAGAVDGYTVAGDIPTGWNLADVVATLTGDPGVDDWGNPAATDLTRT